METRFRDAFRNLSPLDHRYWLANQQLFDSLADYLSEEAQVRYLARVEASLLEATLAAAGNPSPHDLEMIRALPERVDPEAVYAEEESTQHNIRALVNVLKRGLPDRLACLVHVGATSVDILDTAASMRIRDAVRRVVLPVMLGVEKQLLTVAAAEAGTAQVGRTHGQHAVPLTFGYAIAEYVVRFGGCILEIEERSRDLRGKLSGAVGAYNATSLFVEDPRGFEAAVLERLGLRPADHATQLVPPEHLLRLLLALNTAFGVLANLADDLRNLQRSEIGEVREGFAATQVGSSTMPQKRNPWNSEHVKSLWKAFAPRAMTFFMDQISEHQRDLTNSASGRFVADYIAGFVAAVARMGKVLSSLHVDRARMRANLEAAGDSVLAEAAYILLSGAGDREAHETVRRCTMEADRNRTGLADELRRDPKVWRLLDSRLRRIRRVGADEFFNDVGRYKGIAEDRTRELVNTYTREIQRIEEALDADHGRNP